MGEEKVAVAVVNMCKHCESVIATRTIQLTQQQVENEMRNNPETFFVASPGSSTTYRRLDYSDSHRTC